MNRRLMIYCILNPVLWPLANSSDDESDSGPPIYEWEMTRSVRKQQACRLRVRFYRRLSRNWLNPEDQDLRERFEAKLSLSRQAMTLEKNVYRTCRRALRIQEMYEQTPPSSVRRYQLSQQLSRLDDEFYSSRAEADRVFNLVD